MTYFRSSCLICHCHLGQESPPPWKSTSWRPGSRSKTQRSNENVNREIDQPIDPNKSKQCKTILRMTSLLKKIFYRWRAAPWNKKSCLSPTFCPARLVIHLDRLLLVIFSMAAMNSSQIIPTSSGEQRHSKTMLFHAEVMSHCLKSWFPRSQFHALDLEFPKA